MSTTVEAIRTVLAANTAVAALVSGRIFPSLMTQGATMPVIVLSVVSDVPENALTGDSSSRLVSVRLQVDAYAKTYLEAHAVADAVDAVLSALANPAPGLSAWRESSRDEYDNEAQLHRAGADYFVQR